MPICRPTLVAVTLAGMACGCAAIHPSPTASSADASTTAGPIGPACYADAPLTLALDTATSTRRSGGWRNARVIYVDSTADVFRGADFATAWEVAGDSVEVVRTDGEMGTAWRLVARGDTLAGTWTVFGDVVGPRGPWWPVRLVRSECPVM